MSATTFLKTFLQRPGQVGAIAPSSPALARMMVDWIDWSTARSVVEYGPGTGVFTEQILTRLHDDAQFFAIERSPDLCAVVRRRCPQADVALDTVEHVQQLCSQRGIQSVDAVLCGLPWAAFPAPLQQRCLDALLSVLRPGGQFVTFAYWQGLMLPAGRRFRARLSDCFSQIETSPTVWRNLPPAFVYRCRR